MRRGIWVLLGLVAAEVALFGLLTPTAFRNAGNPVLFFLYWFQDAAMHFSPMVAIALAMRLTVRRGGADLALPGAAAVLMALAAWCPADGRFWTVGLAALIAAAIAMGWASGAAVKRLRLNVLIVTLLVGALFRGLAAALVAKAGEPSLLLVPGFDTLESFRYALPLLLGVTAVVAAVLRWFPRAVGHTAGAMLAAVLVTPAALLYFVLPGEAAGPVGAAALLGTELQALAAVVIGMAIGGKRLPALATLLAALAVAMFGEGMASVITPRFLSPPSAAIVFYMVLAVLTAALLPRRSGARD